MSMVVYCGKWQRIFMIIWLDVKTLFQVWVFGNNPLETHLFPQILVFNTQMHLKMFLYEVLIKYFSRDL